MILDEPPPLERKLPRSYPEIAEAVSRLKAARNEYDRARELGAAMYMLECDDLAAMTGLMIDRLQSAIPEEWRCQ